MNPDPDGLIDAICELGQDIARRCPDCADTAMKLVGLAGQLRPAPLDRGAIRDAIESEALDSDLTDAKVSTATEAVMRAAREDPA